MNFLQENALKYTSVKWPLIGAFLLGVIPVLLQEGINTQLIPAEYHSLILTIVLPALAYFGKKKYQPELHPEPTILGFAKLPADSITFDAAFKICDSMICDMKPPLAWLRLSKTLPI